MALQQVLGAGLGRALLWQKQGLEVRMGVQRLGAQPWQSQLGKGGGGVVRFGGEGTKGLEAATAPGTLVHTTRSRRSVSPEGSNPTAAPLELCCCWALGCLGHTVVGLGQCHIAW